MQRTVCYSQSVRNLATSAMPALRTRCSKLMCGLAVMLMAVLPALAQDPLTASSSGLDHSATEVRRQLLIALRRAEHPESPTIVGTHWGNAIVSREGFEFDVITDETQSSVHVSKRFGDFRSLLHSDHGAFACGNGLGVRYEFRVLDDSDQLVLPDCIVRFDDNFETDLVNGLNGMIQYTRDAPSRRAQMDQAVAECSASATEMPDEARGHRVLAENAVSEKDFDKAFDEYEALAIAQPCFANGQFNAALVAGQLGYYDDAVAYMKRYLQLEPNSSDAEAAKDKVIIWQDKVRQNQTGE